MAVVPICYQWHCKDQALSIFKGFRKNEGLSMNFIISRVVSDNNCVIVRKSTRLMDVLQERKCCTPFRTSTQLSIHYMKTASCSSHLSSDSYFEKKQTTQLSSTKKQLRSLDSYFTNLGKNVNHRNLSETRLELLDRSWKSCAEKELAILNNFLGKSEKGQKEVLDLSKAEQGIESLDSYLGKVSKGADVTSASNTEFEETIHTLKPASGHEMEKLKNYLVLENGDCPESSRDDTSSLYLIGILSSINIAVFVFETATPIKSSDLELFSLPLLYGAKINELILIGEWWRLLTPMFLHWGIHHVALGCWMLFTFGPQVCRTYGSFTFILLYVLGGLSGNLASFFHMPEPAVGGTGPDFAILGAWLICQYMNQDTLSKVNSENMIRKAMIATALGCILSNFGPIDDWTHMGATFTGIAYGYLTCPILQMKNATSESGEEGLAFVRRNVGPCKSLLFFSLSVMVLCSLLLIVEPPPSSVTLL